MDRPGPAGPHLHLQPTVYRWGAVAGGEAGGRLLCSGRHNCSSFVRGGVHLTHGAFLPTNIVKVMLELCAGLREKGYKGSPC